MSRQCNVSGVYAIVNLLTKKIYIGESRALDTRIREHFTSLKAGRHQNIAMQRDYDLQGPDAFFTIRIPLLLDMRGRRTVERNVIQIMGSDSSESGYNQSDNWSWSPEARQRDSERKYARKGKFKFLRGVALDDSMLPIYVDSCERAKVRTSAKFPHLR